MSNINKQKISLKKLGDGDQHIQTTSPHPEFISLEKSNHMTDRLIYITTLDLLNNLAIKQNQQNFIASKSIETDDHKQYVLNNWETLSSLFQLPNRLKKNQKMVSQTIKFIINKINDRYQFKTPIRMDMKKNHIYYRDDNGILCDKVSTQTIIRLS